MSPQSEFEQATFVVDGQTVDALGKSGVQPDHSDDAEVQQEDSANAVALAEEREAHEATRQQVKDGAAREQELQTKITDLEARPALPSDALDRLITVKGISPTLAQQALDALKS